MVWDRCNHAIGLKCHFDVVFLMLWQIWFHHLHKSRVSVNDIDAFILIMLLWVARKVRLYCHDQAFSRDHSHDQFPRDPSPDEHLAIRTLFRVMNLVVLQKFDLKHYQGFTWCAQHTFSPVMPLTEDPYHADPYHSFSKHYSVLLCFIVVISRTKTAIEYPSINLVLYSYTPNEDLGSWQIVLAHLTSFL